MFYHVLVEIDDSSKKNKVSYLYEADNQSLDDLKEDILLPYSNEERIYIDGGYIEYNKIRKLKVFTSKDPVDEILRKAQSSLPSNVLVFYGRTDMMNDRRMTDITKEILKTLRPNSSNVTNNVLKENNMIDNKKVFLVHGRDGEAKSEVARFIQMIGLEPIILHEQANNGSTLIEKIERNTDVGYGIILYTPCDVGGLSEDKLSPRARQNVIFEHGYLIGKLGRKKVVALVKPNVEHPSDISGIVYIPHDNHDGWKVALARELKSAGYNIDMNKLF